jgi:hypothetical protein
MLKKLLLSILAVAVLLPTLLVPTAHAQHWYNQNPYEWYDKVYNTTTSPPAEIFGERYTAAQVQWVIYSVLTFPFTLFAKPSFVACVLGMVWGDVTDISTCAEGFTAQKLPSSHLAVTRKKDDKTLLQKVFEERSFSGITYFKSKARKLNLIPEAKAQGFGFTDALNPFVRIWAASRDVVYGLFVIAAVILAFMIMFRVKLSPQVVISVQSAIPKLIITLLLVTFSYAIAGFLVDLMYVAIGIVSLLGKTIVEAVLDSTGADTVAIFNLLTSGDLGGIALGPGGIFVFYILLFNFTLLIVLTGAFSTMLAGISGTVIGTIASIAAGAFVSIAMIIIIIISIIICTVMFFKILLVLAKTFVNVVLLTLLAPFQIFMGIFKSELGFGAWVKSSVSNLAVFVAVGFLFLLSSSFLIVALSETPANFSSNSLGPALNMARDLFGENIVGVTRPAGTTVGWPPLLATSGSTIGFMYITISASIFFMIPKVADIIQGFISGRPFAYGTAIGEAFGPITSPIQQTWGEYQKRRAFERQKAIQTRIDVFRGGVKPKVKATPSGKY